MDEVDHDVHAYVVGGSVDEHNAGTGMGRVAGLGMIEDLGNHGAGSVMIEPHSRLRSARGLACGWRCAPRPPGAAITS
ncbi:hypothetical protein [Nonomuraea sp. NPDC049784]|uniref:hypothetical protein n=1 Tax=Nonomuraea sp. NPDC049784 TaxID=3154361 RepID=UPI0034109FEF